MILVPGGLGSIGSHTARALLDLGKSVVLLANCVSIRFRFRPVADACGAPVVRDQGPDRPAGHGKADPSRDPLHGHRRSCGLVTAGCG